VAIGDVIFVHLDACFEIAGYGKIEKLQG